MMSASTFEAVACYYCGGAAATRLLTAEDDLTGRPGRFTFVRCRDCSLVYQSPRPTLEHVKTYYESEYISHRQPSDWGWLAPLFRRAIESLDRDKIRDAIASTNMNTVIGPVKFRPDGTGIVQQALLQWINGKQELVWPRETATAPLAYPAPPFAKR